MLKLRSSSCPSDAKISKTRPSSETNALSCNLRKHSALNNHKKEEVDEEEEGELAETEDDFESSGSELESAAQESKVVATDTLEASSSLPRGLLAAKSEYMLELSTAKDLSSCGTYKVKIQRRRSSALLSSSLSFKQKENESLSNPSLSSAFGATESSGKTIFLQILVLLKNILLCGT